MANEYKHTLQLPKTAFPMKANLTQTEPEYIKRWQKEEIYFKVLEKNRGRDSFLMHDGPPYANGHIHLGHIMNKTLKDIVVKEKNMSGYFAPFLPGWDCHGLPIEHQVTKKLGAKAKQLEPIHLRKECRKYAAKFVEIQKKEFERLGIFADWDNSYLTMNYEYQAQIAREFGKIVDTGAVYRKRRSIHWCMSCETALAEAEIEYGDHKSSSVFVSYPVIEGWENLGLPKTKPEDRFCMIWTTTPWTLPASMAVAYSETAEYVVVEEKGKSGRYIVAKDLVEEIQKNFGMEDTLQVVAEIGKGEKLKAIKAQHPFIDREIPFLPAPYVEVDTGTGLVHTAPGHGEEDYLLGVEHGIDIYSPVMGDGRFEKDVEHFAGMKVFEANPVIVKHLISIGRLFGGKDIPISHSYPHCWRCKNPVIFRATAQWFVSLDKADLRKRAMEEIDRVTWVPSWGRDRIYGMVEGRPDWCISRQRTWGIPIVAFSCKECGEYLLSGSMVRHVADIFEKESADAWFAHSAEELLPKGTKCEKCGKTEFEKGSDILDVWFDSGSSHAAVLEDKKDMHWPCDLYLEGSDQHRGWFQSSLLEGVATRGKAPFGTVITHGFVVDGEGKKMSKSVGNVMTAEDLLKSKGSEMLRFWVATEDYRGDLRVSNEILDRVVETYRRIRNTARFCLGNLADFNPDKDCVPMKDMAREMDRWAMDRISLMVQKIRKAYQAYDFHVVVQAINEFCVIDFSSLYADVAKDILYCDEALGNRRRSVQTILFEFVKDVALFLAPILPVTTEQIWGDVPAFKGKASSVHLADFPEPGEKASDELRGRWKQLLEIRSEVSKTLEALRKDKKIGQSLEADVEVVLPEAYQEVLKSYEANLAAFWIVSKAKIVKELSNGMEVFESTLIEGLKVGSRRIEGDRCERCWMYTGDIGSNKNHVSLCGRCADVVEKIK